MRFFLALILTSVTAAAAVPDVVPGAAFAVTRLTGQRATATGTWRSLDGDRPAPEPINTVSIGCDGKTRRCIQAEAYLGAINHLFVRSTEFKVTKWDQNEITAEMNARCTRETLVLNLTRKVAYKTIRGIQSAGCTLDDFGRYKTPLMYELGDPVSP